MSRRPSIVPRQERQEEERPGVILLRNSTPKQVDNPRSLKAEEIARGLLDKLGIPVGAVLDEQGTSGKDLSKRPIAKQLVDELEAGKWAAIAIVETSRASRDPDGVDQRIFKRACRRGRALMATESKIFDFRNDSDDLDYEVHAMIDSAEWRKLRRRTWQGNFGRAQIAPVLMGIPPFGYCTIPGTYVVRGTERACRLPSRDMAKAPLMQALGDALDEEPGLAQAAKRLNRLGFTQPNGSPWYWTQMQKVLLNPIYYGVWEYGSTREADDLWEELADGPVIHNLPELAWYTEDRVKHWQKKHTGKGPIRTRAENRPHPLLGVLECKYCRTDMISQGLRGYACPLARGNECKGQNISNQQAEGAVRRLLDKVLPDLAELTARVRDLLEAEAHADVAADLRMLERKITARYEMEAEKRAEGRKMPDDFDDKTIELERQRDVLAKKLADASQAEVQRRRLLKATEQFKDAAGFLALFDEMSAEDQRGILQELFEWVVVDANGGRGTHAKAWVSEYRERFPKSVSSLEPWLPWLNGFEEAA